MQVTELIDNICTEVKDHSEEKYFGSKKYRLKKILKRRRPKCNIKEVKNNFCHIGELVQIESCFGCRLNCAVVVYNREVDGLQKRGMFIHCEEFGYLQMFYDPTGRLKIKKNMGAYSDSCFDTNK